MCRWLDRVRLVAFLLGAGSCGHLAWGQDRPHSMLLYEYAVPGQKLVGNAIPFRPGNHLDEAICGARGWLLRQVDGQEKLRLAPMALASLALNECGCHLRREPFRRQFASAIKWLKYHTGPRLGEAGPDQRDFHAPALSTRALALAGGHARYFILKATVNKVLPDPQTEGADSPVLWSLFLVQALDRFPFFASWSRYGQDSRTAFDQWLKATGAVPKNSGNADMPRLDRETIELARLYFNLRRSWCGTMPCTQYFLANLHPPGLMGSGRVNPWYHYFATRALAERKGPLWRRWRRTMVAHLLANQAGEGCARGSWAPRHSWSRRYGRVYHTALMTLILLRCRATRPTTWLEDTSRVEPNSLEVLAYRCREGLRYVLQGRTYESEARVRRHLASWTSPTTIREQVTLRIKAGFQVERPILKGLKLAGRRASFRRVRLVLPW